MKNLFPENDNYKLKEFLDSYSERLISSLKELNVGDLESVYDSLLKAIKNKSMIYTCGNGGSAAIAEHLVCDFLKGASTDTNVNPKLVPLLSTPTLTAIANDLSYDDVFSYQIEKYASEGDVLLCVSSSGDSENIVRAINTAKKMKVETISFVGFEGGRAKDLSDCCVHVNSNNYGICEDAHHSLMHIFAQFLRLKNIDDSKKIGNIKF